MNSKDLNRIKVVLVEQKNAQKYEKLKFYSCYENGWQNRSEKILPLLANGARTPLNPRLKHLAR